MARSTCFEKSRLLLDLMVDARFNPTIKYDYCDGDDHGNDDGVGHDDDDSDGDVQGSSSSS